MCYFEDCEDRYWPREDNTPDCPCDCDNRTDTGNTNPGGGHICICNCDDCADGICGTTRYYKPGESFCLYDASHSDLYAWSTEPSIIFVGTDGKAVAIREGSAYICIRSRSNPAFRRCIRIVSSNTATSQNPEQHITLLVTAKQMQDIGWNEAKTTSTRIQELNSVLQKYDITTVERIRHFITQCYAEIGSFDAGNDFLEDDNADGTYLINKPYYPYYGAGAIQITHEYGYQAFATFLLLKDFPDLDGCYLSPKSNGKAAIASMYNRVVTSAKNEGINGTILAKYTNIVTIGPEYVAENYAWESAGYYWEANGINEIIDMLTPNDRNGVDQVTAIVNSGTSNYGKRRAIYDTVKQHIT